jgi:diguanylate cyclase (GGDEF)-like protein/PAS domain S-box-containing protein
MKDAPAFMGPLVDALSDRAVVLSVPDFRIVHANRSYLESLGLPLDSLRGRGCPEFEHGHAAGRNGLVCPARVAAETGRAQVFPGSCRRNGDGNGRRTVETVAVPVSGGAETGYVVVISKEKSGESWFLEDLGGRAEFLGSLVQTCPEGIIGHDREGNVFLFNASAGRLLGYTRREVVGRVNVADFYPPGGAREVREFLDSEEYGGRGRLVDFETEARTREGKRIPIRLCATVIHDKGREAGVIGFFTDITLRRAMQQAALDSEERLRGIFEAAGDAILSFDRDNRIVLANRAAADILGCPGGEIVGRLLTDFFPPRYTGHWDEIRRYAVGDDASARKSFELALLSRSGVEVPVQMSLSEKTVRGERIFTAIVRDITERKALEEELRLLSVTDSLTQLYNRRHFHSLAQKEIDRASRTGAPFSVLLVDVDRFKGYNDTYGHLEGDQVLRALAEEIRSNFRTMDSGFRLGGEEFLVLLPETDSAGATVAAERLRIRFADRKFHPVPGEEPVSVTVSIGIAEYREGMDLSDLVRAADLAMYAAKNGGRDRVACYEHLLARSMTPAPPPAPTNRTLRLQNPPGKPI